MTGGPTAYSVNVVFIDGYPKSPYVLVTLAKPEVMGCKVAKSRSWMADQHFVNFLLVQLPVTFSGPSEGVVQFCTQNHCWRMGLDGSSHLPI